MWRRTAIVVLTIFAAGCGKAEPTRAAGKSVSHWVNALRDPDAKVRKDAAFTLGNVGPADPAVVPALISALNDPDDGVRCQAIVGLVKCGPAAGDAIPALESVKRADRNPRVRTYAGQALEKLRATGGPLPGD
jgi:HEAT repeat protein